MSRILVIDDEPHLRTLIEKFLLLDDHEVDLAEDGNKGLKLIEGNSYDLVITDIVMPEKDGLEVIMELKRLFPNIRIIVISGGGERLNIQDLLKMARLMGADRVMSKPLDFIKLQSAVREVLAMQS